MYAAGNDIALGQLEITGLQVDSVTIEALQIREYVDQQDTVAGAA